MEEQNNKFNYTYSVPTEKERREIDGIRRAYAAPDEEADKLQRLRALDKKVKGSATAAALCLGIPGVLLFGLGMAMVMEWSVVGWGIALSVLGCVLAALAYPLSRRVLEGQKKKHAAEILRLSDELLGEKQSEH